MIFFFVGVYWKTFLLLNIYIINTAEMLSGYFQIMLILVEEFSVKIMIEERSKPSN